MAIIKYTKNTAVQISKNFKSTEFDCHGAGCCEETLIDEQLIRYLQQIRDHFGKSVTINSGFRCSVHNKKVNGSTNSRHMKGQAADIKVSGIQPKEVAKYAEVLGIKGIGLYETNADGYFVHIDTRNTKSFWYGQKQLSRDTFQEQATINLTEQEQYYVRKSWEDKKSQIGAYNVLNNAKIACDKAGTDYFVYNSKGEVIYPELKKIEEVQTKMKYSNENKPLVCMQTQSTCYRGTTKMTVKGILWHSTGANNPTIKRYVQPSDNAADREEMLKLLGKNAYGNDWNHIEHQAGLNAWIGKLADGTVTTVQTMPWDYKPWGCGSGSKGSCNNGWIQFEICEDALNNEEYFNAVYKEACELTAYLCHMYNIDPKGTVTVNGVKVPTILCHQDAYKLKMGTNHGDVLHWFPKFNKNMDDVREDVAKLLPTAPNEIPSAPSTIEPLNLPLQVNSTVAIKEGAKYYSGENIPSWVQKKQWIVASIAGDKVIINRSTDGESAINSPMRKTDLIVISNSNDNLPKPLSVGDAVKLVAGATYSSGGKIPSWLFSSKLYIREIRKNGDYVISTVQTGAVTGVVKPASVIPYTTVTISATFEPYFVKVTANSLNVRSGPGTNYKVNQTISRGGIYTIIEEKNGWGKLKSGAGWISLNYTKKL